MVRRSGRSEYMGDEARDAFTGIHYKSNRPASSVLIGAGDARL